MTPEPLNSQSAPVYTVAQIAAAWHMKRQAVQYYLQSVAPVMQIEMRGGRANVWRYDQLPAALREKGDRLARSKGKRNGEQLLVSGSAPWQPAIPMAELHPDCINEAVKRQRAFGPSLYSKNDAAINQQERVAAGIKNYAKIFGHTISEKHWWNLYDCIIDRDAGASNWARLEYLPNNLKRKADRALPPAST